MRIIFPALMENSETKNIKMHKFFMVLLGILCFGLAPYIGYSLSGSFSENKEVYIIAISIVMVITYLINLYFPIILVSVIDAIFYKSDVSLLHITRAILPIRIIFIYLEIIFTSFGHQSFMELSQIAVNIWFFINMFIGLRKVLGYNVVKSLITTVVYATFIMLMLIFSYMKRGMPL